LFEVIDGFGGGEVDAARKLFSFGYGSTPAFPLPPGVTVRMVLTNPTELREAIRHGWKGLDDLRSARAAGGATVIYADAAGRKLWDSI
jgi:hypothetical protein